MLDIFGLTIGAVVCGADAWTEVEWFGKSKEPWLREFLKLDNGIPSHDTFGRVFRLLDSQQFEQAFVVWTQHLCGSLEDTVAVDGKTLRRSHNGADGRGPIHMVSVWAHQNQLVLGQTKTGDKSNEINAIPELLQRLDLRNCTVTIDAMGCQRRIAQEIVNGGADYVLAVKENQPNLCDDIARSFAETSAEPCDYHKTVDKDHGRIETRECWVSTDTPATGRDGDWPHLNAIAMVRNTTERNGKTATQTRYYITSLAGPTAETLLARVRGHWGIENCLHWVLDVAFNEDQCRVRTKNAAQNFAILRHIALNLVKQDKKHKGSVRGKRKRAGWDNQYLRYLLTLLANPDPN